jgi:hypothetical protein
MDSKRKSGIAVVTESAAQASLRRAPAKALAPDEDAVLRMRLGASPPRSAPLERAAPARSDLEIEVLAYEIEAWMKWRAREAERSGVETAPRPAASPAPSRTKEKIVRALRKKL